MALKKFTESQYLGAITGPDELAPDHNASINYLFTYPQSTSEGMYDCLILTE